MTTNDEILAVIEREHERACEEYREVRDRTAMLATFRCALVIRDLFPTARWVGLVTSDQDTDGGQIVNEVFDHTGQLLADSYMDTEPDSDEPSIADQLNQIDVLDLDHRSDDVWRYFTTCTPAEHAREHNEPGVARWAPAECPQCYTSDWVVGTSRRTDMAGSYRDDVRHCVCGFLWQQTPEPTNSERFLDLDAVFDALAQDEVREGRDWIAGQIDSLLEDLAGCNDEGVDDRILDIAEHAITIHKRRRP